MCHHLYVCMENCENLVNHLLLQKHLNSSTSAVEAYSQLKRQLAEKYPNDIDAYIDGKTELITSFLAAEGMDQQVIEDIKKINTKD